MQASKVLSHGFALALLALTSACGGDGAGAESDGLTGLGDSGLPFVGTLTLDQDDWIDLISDYYGVIQVGLPSGRVRRFLDGHDGSRHPRNGSTVFLQGCGAGVSRVAMADERGAAIRVVTPCSNEIPVHSDTYRTDFYKPVLSLDATRLAVQTSQARYDGEFQTFYNVVVFDMAGNQLGEAPGWAPAWTPDGRVVFGSSDGLYIADGDLADPPVRIDAGQLTGATLDPKVHPDGDSVIFEYNQRIWQINLDGSGLEEVAFGSARLSSPAYSPDGSAIAFIASEDEVGALLYLKDIATDDYYPLDIRAQLLSDGIPGGPITWTP